ncbi:MAG TPA: class III extradiol ring-cleavage dioxygenase [Vicinamibacteria bacterium]|nr:class III extradiol ring-cleavage dioxygenase [Vicinamibacteria bacterium]
MERFPALFVSHGAPSVALEEDDYTRALRGFTAGLPAPTAIVVVSAHWEAPGPVRVNVNPRPSLIYDFSGFPDALYRLTYPAPGEPALGREVAGLLAEAGMSPALEASRGWDHGLWVPLRIAFPEARTPVVEVSLPVTREPELLLAIGRALAPLRERGVLLLGSGGIVHNLGRMRFADKAAPAEEWARAFDGWMHDRLLRMDIEATKAYRQTAPRAALAVPTSEHFDPTFFVLGSRAEGDGVATVYEGWHYGSLSMRTFALAPP